MTSYLLSLTASFNGATPLRVWKGGRHISTIRFSGPLQRSHTFEGVEGHGPTAPGPPSPVLQRSHTFEGVEGVPAHWRRKSAVPGFNGATPLRVWKGCRALAVLEPCRGFNGATPLRVWKAPHTPPPTHPAQGFNGATPLRVWKGCAVALLSASGSCFNGATPLRVWKDLGVGFQDAAGNASTEPHL